MRSAVALNMIDMIGVGPFITLPLMLQALGGPQAMLGWVLGAGFALCDGMIWAELGAAFPGPGGSYRYLNEIYGPGRWGRLASFLFVWQLSFTAPLSIASGCIGFTMYATWFWPALGRAPASHLFAAGVCLCTAALLYRGIAAIGRLAEWFWSIVVATTGWVIFAAVTHFHPSVAFDFPPHAFAVNEGFILGMGSVMLIAAYDYWGYYNVGFLGGEVRSPERNIPRAIVISILLVGAIYVVMNIGMLGTVPWRELVKVNGPAQSYVATEFIQRVYGNWAARAITALVMATAFASVFSLLLGYSRVPYAAAVDGNYFASFARLHARDRFPQVSLLALAGVAAAFCFFSLKDVIADLVVIRISLQFLLQAVGVVVLRRRRPELPRPYRMWGYPVTAGLAIAGFVFVLAARTHAWVQLELSGTVLLAGLAIFLVRARRRGEWPYA